MHSVQEAVKITPCNENVSGKLKANVAYSVCWDRVATGRRHPSLHMDVRFLARPSERYKPHSPPLDQN
jgi:hypothetical protein